VELNRRATERALRIGEVWRRAELVMELDGDEKAEPLLRELLDHEPDHVAANFALGRILLARGEAAGREALERAVQRDPAARAGRHPHVLAVELRNRWWRRRRSGWSRGVLRRLVAEVPVPGQWFAVSLAGKNARIGKKLKRLPGARL